jgi:PAS domain S-box-containing protein
MNSSKKKPSTPWPLIVLFSILSVITVAGGFFYYRILEKNLLDETMEQLSAIADLKVRQINQWRQERLSDGLYLRNNIPHVKQLSEFLNNSGNSRLKEDLVRSFRAYTENYDYRSVLLIDRQFKVRLYYPDKDTVIGEHLHDILPEVIGNGDVVVTDLHEAEDVFYYHLGLIVPLKEPGTTESEIFGLVVMRIDPEIMLFPIIESWPVTSNTAEALLINVEEDEIVYLNSKKHQYRGGIGLRMPVTENRLPASLAVQGITETTDGIDYSGVRVVAAMKKVPATQWYLIVKIDREEVFSALKGTLGQIVTITTLIILTLAFFLVFLLWNQRAKFYKGKYEDELERMALIRHFDYILKYANDIILLFNKDYIIVEANDRAIDTYQYSRNELIGKNVTELRSPEGLSTIKKDLDLLEKNGSATLETVHRRKDGTTFPIEISARKVDIEGAKFYQSISRDISERKEAEETLMNSEERFRKVFEDSLFGMVMTGKDLFIIKANSAFCRMLGYSEEELIGHTFKDFTHPEHLQKDEMSVLRLIAREMQIYHTEKRYIRKDGSTIWGSTTVNIIRNKEGEAQILFAMVEDITERKKTESDLITAKEKAEESDRLKTAFLHNVSHEIRTPMNAILGFSSLLNEPGIQEEERNQFIEVISQSSSQLLSIINDIVDLASIESGQVRLNIRKININDELRNLREQFSYKQKPVGISLNLKTTLEDNDAYILTDKTKLIQILSNLINNAFKFTKEGNITFGYELKNSDLEFFVEDTGVGIPLEYKDRVFDRFYQVDSTVSRQYSGTGLGLSICKAYVELLGGRIWLNSAPDEGSIFYFTIPYMLE